jgi:hypothetical protein
MTASMNPIKTRDGGAFGVSRQNRVETSSKSPRIKKPGLAGLSEPLLLLGGPALIAAGISYGRGKPEFYATRRSGSL